MDWEAGKGQLRRADLLLSAAVVLMTLAKGPRQVSSFHERQKVDAGVRRRVLRLKRRPGMVIVQVNVHSGPVRHTRKCNILVKRQL